MFGVSMWEIAIVVIVLLALVGPGKIPELAKTVGKALGSFRRSVDEVKKEVNLDEELDFLKDVKDVSAYDVLAEDSPTNESVSMPAGPGQKQPARSGRRKVKPGKKGLAQALFGGDRQVEFEDVGDVVATGAGEGDEVGAVVGVDEEVEVLVGGEVVVGPG